MIFALGGGFVRAEGIALSTDGLLWLPGVGGYGDGWGAVGRGINVEAGSTVYIRYYSDAANGAALHYAAHGTKWGTWERTGPVLDGTIGSSRANPIILKLARVGTPACSIVWMNGSGSWSGPSFPGVYDLALDRASMWTLPPLVVANRPRTTWWAGLARLFSTSDTGLTEPGGAPVPDYGGSATMLGWSIMCAVAGHWLLRRRMRHKKTPTRRSPEGWPLGGPR